MEAAIFILVMLVFGLVSYLTQLSPWITGVCSLVTLAGHIAWALRQRDRALKPLRSDFNSLFQQFASRYGHTKSGRRFLETASKPIPSKSKLDEAMGDFMSAGQSVYSAVTDPASLLLGLALAPVLAGVGSLIGKVWKDERTEEQKRSEAVLLQARYAMDQRSDACYHGIFASGAVAVGIVVVCAMLPPSEFAPQAAASEPVATAPSLVATPPVSVTPSPVVESAPRPAASTPAPEPTVVASTETVSTPTPSQTFATVAEAQRAALKRYPALGIAGSEFNAAFVARYKLYRQTRPEYFQDESWPMTLALEVSQGAR